MTTALSLYVASRKRHIHSKKTQCSHTRTNELSPKGEEVRSFGYVLRITSHQFDVFLIKTIAKFKNLLYLCNQKIFFLLKRINF